MNAHAHACAGIDNESQEQNNAYLRAIGSCFDNLEVHCIVIVLGIMPRWNRVLQQFFQSCLTRFTLMTTRALPLLSTHMVTLMKCGQPESGSSNARKPALRTRSGSKSETACTVSSPLLSLMLSSNYILLCWPVAIEARGKHDLLAMPDTSASLQSCTDSHQDTKTLLCLNAHLACIVSIPHAQTLHSNLLK